MQGGEIKICTGGFEFAWPPSLLHNGAPVMWCRAPPSGIHVLNKVVHTLAMEGHGPSGVARVSIPGQRRCAHGLLVCVSAQRVVG